MASLYSLDRLCIWSETCFRYVQKNDGLAMKYFNAFSLFIAGGQLAAARYIMQPTPGGAYRYGPESTLEATRVLAGFWPQGGNA